MKPSTLNLLLVLSGASALVLETVWMRRLALVLGSSGLAVTGVLSAYMGGLGMGGWWASRQTWRRPYRAYAYLEWGAALCAISFPWALWGLETLPYAAMGLGTIVLIFVPAWLHGATLPALSAHLRAAGTTATLYAANTAGAVMGTLGAAFFALPLLGVRGTELMAAGGSAIAGCIALFLSRSWSKNRSETVPSDARTSVERLCLLAAAITGTVSMAADVAWARVGALLLGGSVHAFAIVLATFLVCIALGAVLYRNRTQKHTKPALGHLLILLGATVIFGAISWRWLPHFLAQLYAMGMDPLWAGGMMMVLTMGPLPLVSGFVFARCVDQKGQPAVVAGQILAANTVGGGLGAAGSGLLIIPAFGLTSTALLFAGLATITGGIVGVKRRPANRKATALGVVAVGLLGALTPAWNPALYAVGVGLRLHEFADLSPDAIETFAHSGWTLLHAEDGRTASVAVGQSTRTDNIWLSINGKVDASTGDDMPTQQLSGQIPVAIARAAHGQNHPGPNVAVVGLASGVTAGEALASGARALTVVELESAVIRASTHFNHVNHQVLADPRTTLVQADARSWLGHTTNAFDVMVSEPSNPWLTGVSNLFTHEYWTLAQSRLSENGVFCQWIQLYGLPPLAFRSLIRTYLDVFPNTWLFETIVGSDALLISAPQLPEDLPLQPTLGPNQLRELAAGAPLNTDDRPWIEFEAPHWLHRSTASENAALIERHQRQ